MAHFLIKKFYHLGGGGGTAAFYHFCLLQVTPSHYFFKYLLEGVVSRLTSVLYIFQVVHLECISGVGCSAFLQWVKRDGVRYCPGGPTGHGFQQTRAWKAYNRAQPGKSGILNIKGLFKKSFFLDWQVWLARDEELDFLPRVVATQDQYLKVKYKGGKQENIPG